MLIFVVKYHIPYEGFTNLGFFDTEAEALECVAIEHGGSPHKQVSDNEWVDSWGNRITIDRVEVLEALSKAVEDSKNKAKE